jgi:hypothetical protein
VYLKNLGKREIHLAGYSFGTWVNTMGLENFGEVNCVVMVSPPVNFMDFSLINSDQRIRLVISGSNDEIAPPRMVKEMIPTWNTKAIFHEIPDADHFYFGKTEEIEKIIGDFIANQN